MFKSIVVGATSAVIVATSTLAVAHRSDPDGHVQVDHVDVCTVNGGDNWQAAWSAYNVRNGGDIVTPANGGYLPGATQWIALSEATRVAWENAVSAAIQRACHPIVP